MLQFHSVCLVNVDEKLFFFPETKSQFARDDPAFLVLFILWLCGKFYISSLLLFPFLISSFYILVSSMVFGFFLDLSIGSFIKFLLYTVFIDCLLVGAGIATIMW